MCSGFTSMTFQSQFVHTQRDTYCSLRRTSPGEVGPSGRRHTPGQHSWSFPAQPTRNSGHRRICEPHRSWRWWWSRCHAYAPHAGLQDEAPCSTEQYSILCESYNFSNIYIAVDLWQLDKDKNAFGVISGKTPSCRQGHFENKCYVHCLFLLSTLLYTGRNIRGWALPSSQCTNKKTTKQWKVRFQNALTYKLWNKKSPPGNFVHQPKFKVQVWAITTLLSISTVKGWIK